MKLLPTVLIILSIFISFSTEAEKPKNILILVSNVEDMGDPEKHVAKNNLLEVAPPFHVFLMHGYEVEFASPKGGVVPFSSDPIGISSYAIAYEGFLEKANSSIPSRTIDPEDYSGVFIGGGAGPLFDIASDEATLSLIAKIYESGGVIGGCGHGPGGFANVKLSTGEYMVKGKKIAGFPDSTEKSKPWSKQGTLLPFLVESQLRKNGAIALNKETLPDKHAVVIDQRIVSTMFLPSAALVAKEMIELIEKK